MATATYEPITTVTVANSTTTSVTLSGIAGTYTDLRLQFVGTTSANGVTVVMQFNGDTGANYSDTLLYGTGTTATSARNTGMSYMPLTSYTQGGDTTNPASGVADIFSYAGSTYKTSLTTVSADYNGSGRVEQGVLLWRNTAAITSIRLFCDSGTSFYFGNGATITLWGIKAA